MQQNPMAEVVEDVSNLITSTSNGNISVHAYKIGKIIHCDGTVTPVANSSIQNKAFANLDPSICPSQNTYIPVSIIKTYNDANSPLYAHRFILNASGAFVSPNEGGFNTIGAVTNLTRITFNATWVIS